MICLQYRHCAGCCFPQGRHAIACYRCRVRSSYRVIACPSSSTTCCPIRFCPSLRTVSFFCKWGPWVSQLLEYRARKFPFHHILDILAALCPPHLPLPPLASLSHILLIPPLIPPSLKFPSILVHLQTLRPRYPTTNCNYRARSTPLAPPPFLPFFLFHSPFPSSPNLHTLLPSISGRLSATATRASLLAVSWGVHTPYLLFYVYHHCLFPPRGLEQSR